MLALLACTGLSLRGSTSRAAYAPPPPSPQTDDSLPARNVTMIAATPEEPDAPGAAETWGIGAQGNQREDDVLVRYAQGQGWVRGPALPEGFAIAPDKLLAARMTPRGAGAMVGTIANRDVVLVREPGGAFVQTTPVPTEGEAGEGGAETPEPLLTNGEELFEQSRAHPS